MKTTISKALLLLAPLALIGHLAAETKAPAQLWARQLGTPVEDTAGALAVDPDGNCYVAGSTSGDLAGPNAGKNDILVGKFDTTGQRLWLIQFGTPGLEIGMNLRVDRKGNLYVGGSAEFCCSLSADGTAYFVSMRRGGSGGWTAPADLNAYGPVINTPTVDEYAPSLSPDGRILFFARQGAQGDVYWVENPLFKNKH